ncbi:response regulator [Stenotrophomonas rhizophila]|uniref:response regulator n=1 Tax=Stenotrophomonas rhizophila TaxID=216778 RepID=UPI00351316F2
MQPLYPWLTRLLAQRPDTEHGQVVVRIALISLILLYVLLAGARNHLLDQYHGVLATALTGLGMSLLLLGWLLWRPQRSHLRRVVGMLADYGLIALGMIQMGEPLAWVYAVVMWVTVGNGLRYGNRYLAAAIALAMLGFGTTVLLTPYWMDNARLAFFLWLGLAVVPMCCSTLLRRRMRVPPMNDSPRTGHAGKQHLLARFRQRLSGRPDSEHAQNLIRIAITALFIIYLGWRYLENHGDTLLATWLILAFELTVSAGLLVAILLQPGVSHVRRVIGMLTDYSCMGLIMTIQGEPAAPLYAVCLWVTIGNGMRYGSTYLRVATAMGCVAFLCTIMLAPYWQQHSYLAWGLLLGLAAIPLYFDSLLHALTRAVAEARQANEAKSRFLANMSHEFRTPLNGLAGMTEVLATTRLDEEQRECLNTIQASARSLLALVEEVLDISAIEAGKVRVERHEFALADVLQAINLILTPQARTKALEYRVVVDEHVPPRLYGDAGHLQQILLNLMGNAVKFTDDGFVELRVSLLDGQAGERVMLRFEILDSGIGVPAALRERLFDAFEQADVGLARRHEGTGLGTSIAKGLVESMGGRIGYSANSPRGSVFWVEIALDVAMTPVLSGDTTENGNVIAFSNPFLRHRARVRSLRVLVADDHAANRMVLQRLLEKAGHKVVCVNGGEQVLDMLEQSDFDTAIVDLHMPGMSGLDLLKQLRVMQASGMPYIPVMVLSADVTPDSILRCEQAGARAFLAKPVVATRLLDILADIAANTRPEPGIQAVPAAPVVAGALDPAVLDELAALGMGEGFEKQFIAQCLSDVDGCMARIQASGEQQAWDQLREHAHALRGVASNLGLVQVASAGGELMRMPDWQLKAEWTPRAAALGNALRQGRKALDARAVALRQSDGDECTPS